MSCYSQNTNTAAAVLLYGDTGIALAEISARIYGDAAAATASRYALVAANAGGTQGALTSENLNSRSAATAGRSNNSTGIGNNLVLMAMADFTHHGWITSRPNIPMMRADDTLVGSAISSPSSIGTLDHVFSENTAEVGRRVSRRCSKTGFFCTYGNQIAHYQKTGGGAYSIKAPNFDNDITWVDSSAWRNGMSQGDVWNIQLFGIPPDTTSFIAPTLDSLFGQPDTQSFDLVST